MRKKVAEVLERVAQENEVLIEKIGIFEGRESRLEIIVDNPTDIPGSPTVECLAEISRKFTQVIERLKIFPGAYRIQVSSPGLDRKFQEDRHWEKAVGCLVRLTFVDDGEIVARLDNFDAAAQRINIRQRKQVRKGVPVSYHDAEVISLKDVKTAKVEIEF